MSDDPKRATPAKIKTDSRGRSVWADAVETAQLELISTEQLQALLASDDIVSQRSIEEAASCGDEGVLARDAATGIFEIIDDFDIQAILEGNLNETARRSSEAEVILEPAEMPGTSAPEELSLVSTQMLRKVLGEDDSNESESTPELGGGFDPYNSS